MNSDFAILSLAMKAGKVTSGEFSVEKAVKSSAACLVIVADDASENTKKEFRDMCTFYETPIIFGSSKEELGHLIGKEQRASLAILDPGFANSLMKKLNHAQDMK